MASLRLPRLCCPVRDEGTELVLGSKIYHAACVISAVLALLGLAACYHWTERRQSQAWRMGARVRLASFLVTAGLLVHSVLWLSVPDFMSNQVYWLPHILCIITSTWIHYFCSVLFWAFFCYSLEIAQLLSSNPSERFGRLFTFLCWGAPSLILLHGVLMLIPSENRCDSKKGLILFHDVSFYIPLLLALFGSPLLLRSAIARVPTVLKMQCGVYTCRERFRQQSLCRRLMQISCALMACWLLNVLCDFILLLIEVLGNSAAPRQLQVAALTLFVITGILNPMFCCVHSLAFFGWRSFAACVNHGSTAPKSPPVTGHEGDSLELQEEDHLLLQVQSTQTAGKLSFPEILHLMDSCSSMEFRCSTFEINAVHLLGTQDSVSTPLIGSELRPQHSNV